MANPSRRVLRLSVVGEPEPATLARVTGFLQSVNSVPSRLVAELDPAGHLKIQADIIDVGHDRLALIAAKLGQIPCVWSARCDCL